MIACLFYKEHEYSFYRMSARLSIIIPAKDEKAFLPDLLQSIKEQTVPPYEIIVADAGSADGTQEIARSFGAKVVPGGLPGPGRNKGAAAATGDILLFLDADVTLPQKDFLEKALGEFTERKLDIATADVLLKEGKPYDKVTHEFYNAYARLWGTVHPHAPGFCIMVRKNIHDAIQGFDETVQFCEDHDYAHRASRVGSFGFLNTVRIGVTTRRQERDGRFSMALKYALAEMHLLILGPIRHDKFKYGFGYDKKTVEKVKKTKS